MKPTDLASYPHTERDLPLPKTPKETMRASRKTAAAKTPARSAPCWKARRDRAEAVSDAK
jgi:hypothetical protein